MGTDGHLCTSTLGTYGYLWAVMDTYGHLWVLIGTYGH